MRDHSFIACLKHLAWSWPNALRDLPDLEDRLTLLRARMPSLDTSEWATPWPVAPLPDMQASISELVDAWLLPTTGTTVSGGGGDGGPSQVRTDTEDPLGFLYAI
jgi:hypothetical protein